MERTFARSPIVTVLLLVLSAIVIVIGSILLHRRINLDNRWLCRR